MIHISFDMLISASSAHNASPEFQRPTQLGWPATGRHPSLFLSAMRPESARRSISPDASCLPPPRCATKASAILSSFIQRYFRDVLFSMPPAISCSCPLPSRLRRYFLCQCYIFISHFSQFCYHGSPPLPSSSLILLQSLHALSPRRYWLHAFLYCFIRLHTLCASFAARAIFDEMTFYRPLMVMPRQRAAI